MRKQILYKSLFIVILTTVLVSCSTKKNTFVSRNIHELTSHYNVYFNGNEAYKLAIEKADEKIGDDYTKILPIYKESQPQIQKIVAGDMDVAVEKATKLIKFHSITVPPDRKGKKNRKKPIKSEYNKWIDDAYILMGKAYLAKGDLLHANGTFSTVLRKFKDDPVKYEAYIWLVRTLTLSERYAEGFNIIETLEGDDNFPSELEGELAIAAADLALKQDKYDDAIQYLNIGVNNIKGNKRKTRLTYILAQLYQETGKNAQALEAYNQVIRRKPDYEMRFNAQINGASVYTGDGGAISLRKELLKMTKKIRNKAFLDQIYFALGNLSFSEENFQEAKSYYQKSAKFAVKNIYQRTLSCLTLAQIYFDEKKYVPAGMYYDSAMIVMDEFYPNYQEISTQYNSLNNLVTNLIQIQTQDSLQHLATLTDAELNKKIGAWVEEAKKKQENEAQQELVTSNNQRLNNNRKSSSGWYFYNPSTIAFGKKEFEQRWGKRKLVDNWRRSDQSTQIISTESTNEEGTLADEVDNEVVKELRVDDPTNPKFYVQDIPTNDSLLANSNLLIRDALFNAGMVFRTDFNDLERSIECFLELNNRFPENIYNISAFFNLYDLYKLTNQQDNSNYYRNYIIDNYPETNYAKFLKNPNFFIEQAVQKDSLNKVYYQSLIAYRNHNYTKAAALSAKALSFNPDSTIQSKVKFINIVTSNANKPKSLMIEQLTDFKTTYPTEPLNQIADQIIQLAMKDNLNNYQDLVNSGYLNDVITNMEVASKTEESEMDAKWDQDEDLFHYFIIAIPNNETVDENYLKFDLANYNIDHYMTRDFEIETEALNADTKLILVRNLDDKESGLIYFMSIIRKPEVFKTLAGKQYLNFIISNNNYRQMKEDQSFDDYIKFFVKNYSNITAGDFDEADLETPEELMARLKEERTKLKEKGEFVLVNAAKKTTTTTKSFPSIFKTNYADEHWVMLLLEQANYPTAFSMRSFIQFNTINYRSSSLRTVPVKMGDYTTLNISKFANAQFSDDYLKRALQTKNLFATLTDVKYHLVTISKENFNLLKANNEFENYLNFYKENYAVIPEIKVEEPAIVAQTELPATSKEVSKPKETPPEIEAKTIDESKVAVEENAQEAEPTKSEKATDKNAETVVNKTTVEPKTPEPTVVEESINEPVEETTQAVYSKLKDTPHNVAFVIPAQGVNSALLTMYINRFKSISFSSITIEVGTVDFNSVKKIVRISGFANSDIALSFSEGIAKDQRVTLALRNVNFHRIVISNDNIDKMIERNDLNGYQSFYNRYYP